MSANCLWIFRSGPFSIWAVVWGGATRRTRAFGRQGRSGGQGRQRSYRTSSTRTRELFPGRALKACLAVGLLFASTGDAKVQSAALGLYNEANGLYRKGQFMEARDKYLQVVNSGVQNGQVYYNLGNACFKVNRLGEAILWYERALRLEPRDADIQANLRFANKIKKDREPAKEENPIWLFLVAVYLYPTLNELGILFGVSFFLLFLAAAWGLWNRGRKRTAWLGALLTCVFLALSSGFFFATRIYVHTNLREGIITAEEGIARSGPDRDQTVVFQVHEGTKVKIERQELDWLLIRLDNGWGGWLPAAVVSVI